MSRVALLTTAGLLALVAGCSPGPVEVDPPKPDDKADTMTCRRFLDDVPDVVRRQVVAGVECTVPDLPAQLLVLLLHAARDRSGRGERDIEVAWGRADDAFVGERWIPFLEIFPGGQESLTAPIADDAVRQALGRRGVYVIARFAAPPTGAPDVKDPAVVYVGETHGRTASLRSRLLQFGRSAGLFPSGRRAGHYAAWSFADTGGGPVPASEVYVALLLTRQGRR